MATISSRADHEAARLEALRRYRILDTPPERAFDDITALAAFICGVPIALLSLVDDERQWFKAKRGLATPETQRDHAFCAHTITQTEVMIVRDAAADPRFAANPLVTSAPHIRFYAGAPLLTSDGFALGSLCVIDHEPRELSEAQCNALAALARQVIDQFEQLRISSALAEALSTLKTLEGVLPICSHCKAIRDDGGQWQRLETYVRSHTHAELSHGLCPGCLEKHYADFVPVPR